MKSTGRILTLRGEVNPNDVNSVTFSNVYANQFFHDDRTGYGWKVVDFALMPGINSVGARNLVGLWTINPERLTAAQGIRMLAVESAATNNQCIAIYAPGAFLENKVLDPQHVIVDSLAIVAETGDAIPYIVTLEEFEISDYEEIIQRLKETAQDVEDAD